jgi:uncharacterized protein (DUF433 family)
LFEVVAGEHREDPPTFETTSRFALTAWSRIELKVVMPEPTPLDTIEKALSDLSPGEKAHLLQRVARELGGAVPGIDTDRGVCGGEACIARTRIPVWLLVRARRLGASEALLLQAYPALRAEDLVNAWAYAQLHPAEIEELIDAHEVA